MSGKTTIYALAAAALLAGAAAAQQAAPPPASVIPMSALDNLPHKDIGNGIITAKVYLPEGGFYRGTRFDHAGLVAHATYKGQDYGDYWVSSYSPFVHDFLWQDGHVIGSQASSVTGPVEEFGTIGFDEAGMGGRYLKIGVGIMKRDTDKYDFVRTYPILNEGRRGSSATKNSVRFTQSISGDPSGYGYSYVKTVRLVPGKPQMIIEHVLTNTGRKDIVTSVYCHNFLTLSPGNADITLTAPFTLTAGKPLAPEAAAVDGNTLRYLRPIPEGESVTAPFTGYGDTAADYDFKVVNTKTGFGQRIRADQPLSQINFWSIRTVFSWEPYVAISLKPGQTKKWSYTYDYFGPEK